jgi:CMP-N-acetylneuraminic acid synthetase
VLWRKLLLLLLLPSADADQALRQLLRQQLAAGVSVSACSKQLAKQFSLPRGRVYKLALELDQKSTARQQQQAQQ